MYKYYFHIIDNEFSDEYDFIGYFNNHMEADKFIHENEAVGNVVTILSPYYEWVSLDEVPDICKEG